MCWSFTPVCDHCSITVSVDFSFTSAATPHVIDQAIVTAKPRLFFFVILVEPLFDSNCNQVAQVLIRQIQFLKINSLTAMCVPAVPFPIIIVTLRAMTTSVIPTFLRIYMTVSSLIAHHNDVVTGPGAPHGFA